MREKFRQFMIGRYGTDGLNQFLSIASIVLLLISLLTRFSLFTWLGLGLLVLEAAESLQNGMSVEDTIALLEKRREHQLGAFVIRTLEFLRKGGRIGRVEGAIGSLLQIKPVIYVNDEGVYNTLCKARGFSNALTAMVDEIIRRYQGHKVRLAVVHGAAYDDAVKLRDRLMERLDVVSSFISPVSPALAIHTGPGLLGAIVQLAE